jgi:uncharacterized membrane protein YczE
MMWKNVNRVALAGLFIWNAWLMMKRPPPAMGETLVAVFIMGTIFELLQFFFRSPDVWTWKYRFGVAGLAIVIGTAAYVLPRL